MVLEIEEWNCSPHGLVLGVGDLVGLGLLVLLEGYGVLALQVGVHGYISQCLAAFFPSGHLFIAEIAGGPCEGEMFPQLTLTHVEARLA